MQNTADRPRAVSGRTSPAARQAARQVLLLCTGASIDVAGRGRLSQILAGDVDWEYLLRLAEFHGVTPLIAHALAAEGICGHVPRSCRDRLNQVYYGTLRRNVILLAELAKILSVFSQRGIAAIPLKGTVLAEDLYGNPGLRTVADIDILVHPNDMSRARSVLAKLGYQQPDTGPHWEHAFHEAPYYRQAEFPFFVELHWDLEDSNLVTVPEQEIWRRARPQQLQGISTVVLSPEDNLLFLANHLPKHETQLLKFLGDIAALLKKYQDHLDWDYITQSAGSWQIETVVYYALRRAKDLLGAPVPLPALEELRPGYWRRWVLDFLVGYGIFVSSGESDGLRQWTSSLVRGLMMRHFHQTLTVLSRQQGPWKRGAWLRTSVWIALVLIVGLGRHWARLVSRWLRRVSWPRSHL